MLKSFFQLQVTIPSPHPVQISCPSDYCITLIIWYHTKKLKNTAKSEKRGLATTVQPDLEFSRTCGFCEVLGINEDCSNAKFRQNP